MPKKKQKPSAKKTSTKKTSIKKTSTKKPIKKKDSTKTTVKKKVSVKKTTKKKEIVEITTQEKVSEKILEKEKAPPREKKETLPEVKKEIKHGFIAIPHIWPDHLTKYERSRIIGARALQISMGAPILIEMLETIGNPVEVAEKEVEDGHLPLTIRRILPDGEIIDITLEELLKND